MLIEQKDKYISSLINLWHKVFGDETDYIRLFFKEAYYDSECFAVNISDETVSGLYLLKCIIKYDGKIYRGRYLYAAATLPQYRGKGYMSQLIKEALDYAKKEKLDFIALVPADDGLYGYYSGFGFREAMYKYKLSITNKGKCLGELREINPDGFYSIRSLGDNMLIYEKISSDYSFDCLKYSGNKIYLIDDKSYYIKDEELFCADGFLVDTADKLMIGTDSEIEIYTNCVTDDAEKIRNGMIYCLNNELENKEIYMNIALD